MTDTASEACFEARLLRPESPGTDASWAFLVLPKEASDILPRRGRASVEGTLNGHAFVATLDPDGQLSHWLRVEQWLYEAADATVGDTVKVVIRPVASEPEPKVPPDLEKALDACPEAQTTWSDTTVVARLDWIHWVESAKQTATRARRVATACDKLASGKRRVCCFDQSGYYSKSLSAPKAVATGRMAHPTTRE